VVIEAVVVMTLLAELFGKAGPDRFFLGVG
jgi:hypothetical protein